MSKIDAFLSMQRPGQMRGVQFFNFNRDNLVTCGLRIESESSEPRVTHSVSADGQTTDEAFDHAMEKAIIKFGVEL